VRSRRGSRFTGALAAAATALVLGAPASGAPSPPRYYLSLGDSLSNGTQPDGRGHNHPTAEGYVDIVGSYVRRLVPALQLVKLGGRGTSASVIAGPPIDPGYGPGSQLRQAQAFLARHRSETVLVTVDIGDNDVERCIGARGIDDACVSSGMASVARNLVTIGSALRAAGGPRVTIVGVSSYDQFWAFWLNGARGRRIARRSAHIVTQLNQTEGQAWRQSGVFVADAGPRFATGDRRRVPLRGHGLVPRAVQRVCQLTWACSPPPINFNDHANRRGYAVIAHSVIAVIRRTGLGS
jgi:lysophospholipase L1-like esterase